MTAEPLQDAAWPAELTRVRTMAFEIARDAQAAITWLTRLDIMFAGLATDGTYAEHYSSDEDTDALADVGDAMRSLRSFARIARERAARTEREP